MMILIAPVHYLTYLLTYFFHIMSPILFFTILSPLRFLTLTLTSTTSLISIHVQYPCSLSTYLTSSPNPSNLNLLNFSNLVTHTHVLALQGAGYKRYEESERPRLVVYVVLRQACLTSPAAIT
ncbi:hypothetical protein BDW69DRAFT_87976 [Aspergillus filifer]